MIAKKEKVNPVIFLQLKNDDQLRPQYLSEPILDGLALFDEDECSNVYLTEVLPDVSSVTVSTDEEEKKEGKEKTNEGSSTRIIVSLSPDSTYAKKHATQKCTLGHSPYSPIRRLKKYLLQESGIKKEEESSSEKGNFELHNFFISNILPKQEKYAHGYPRLGCVMITLLNHDYPDTKNDDVPFIQRHYIVLYYITYLNYQTNQND
ncbi:hypothetical protein RFI_29771, partial [Reticulomyxa filosa]